MADPAVGQWTEGQSHDQRRDLAARIAAAPVPLPPTQGLLQVQRLGRELRTWAAQLLKTNSVPEYDHLRVDDILWMVDQVHPALLVVAVIGQHPAALVGARPEGPNLHLLFMDVERWAQGKGLGSWLLRALQWHATSVGRPIVAEVHVGNHRALTFYRRHGFVICGSLKDYYEEGIDALAIRWNPPGTAAPA